jgi:hypothetical protein
MAMTKQKGGCDCPRAQKIVSILAPLFELNDDGDWHTPRRLKKTLPVLKFK